MGRSSRILVNCLPICLYTLSLSHQQTEEGSGNDRRIQKENDESLTVNQVPSTPADCHQLTCMTFNFPRHCNDSRTPLPVLNWADSKDFWAFLKDKDREYPKSGQYMGQHPALQPKMRTILLDWLIEVGCMQSYKICCMMNKQLIFNCFTRSAKCTGCIVKHFTLL